MPNADQTDIDGDGIGAACDPNDEPCGDGDLDLYRPSDNPPACPNPSNKTSVYTKAQLLAWAANPTTSAQIKDDIDFGGGSFEAVTRCNVYIFQNVELTGLANLFIAAKQVDIKADIIASG